MTSKQQDLINEIQRCKLKLFEYKQSTYAKRNPDIIAEWELLEAAIVLLQCELAQCAKPKRAKKIE